jgi:hypothetical protein
MFPTINFEGAGTAEDEQEWTLTGIFPQLQFDTPQQSLVYSFVFAGKIPPLSFVGDGYSESEQYGVLDVVFPVMQTGDLEIYDPRSFMLDGKFPALEFIGDIIGDVYFNISGMFPQINGSLRVVSDVVSQIIRHRR